MTQVETKPHTFPIADVRASFPALQNTDNIMGTIFKIFQAAGMRLWGFMFPQVLLDEYANAIGVWLSEAGATRPVKTIWRSKVE